jgi:hypothetical protein
LNPKLPESPMKKYYVIDYKKIKRKKKEFEDREKEE